MTKIVVQCSGGLDSTVLIGLAISQHGKENVFPIAFDDASIFWKHRDSIAVKRVVTNFQLHHNLFVCRMLQTDTLECKQDSEYEDVGFIPGYKLLMNISSLAYAQSMGANQVWVGNMGDNVYADESFDSLADTASLYNSIYAPKDSGLDVGLVTPFRGWSKASVIKLGVDLGVDVYDTLSCGSEVITGALHCGVCAWCRKRQKGFYEAGVKDKTTYLLNPFPYNPAESD